MQGIANHYLKISKYMKTPKTVSTPCGERLPFSLFVEIFAISPDILCQISFARYLIYTNKTFKKIIKNFGA